MRKVPNLSISPEKVFFIVAKARRSDGEAAGLDLASYSERLASLSCSCAMSGNDAVNSHSFRQSAIRGAVSAPWC